MVHLRTSVFHVLLLLFIDAANGQIRVLQPPPLADAFPRGMIRGSTAAFGTPVSLLLSLTHLRRFAASVFLRMLCVVYSFTYFPVSIGGSS